MNERLQFLGLLIGLAMLAVSAVGFGWELQALAPVQPINP